MNKFPIKDIKALFFILIVVIFLFFWVVLPSQAQVVRSYTQVVNDYVKGKDITKEELTIIKNDIIENIKNKILTVDNFQSIPRLHNDCGQITISGALTEQSYLQALSDTIKTC